MANPFFIASLFPPDARFHRNSKSSPFPSPVSFLFQDFWSILPLLLLSFFLPPFFFYSTSYFDFVPNLFPPVFPSSFCKPWLFYYPFWFLSPHGVIGCIFLSVSSSWSNGRIFALVEVLREHLSRALPPPRVRTSSQDLTNFYSPPSLPCRCGLGRFFSLLLKFFYRMSSCPPQSPS